MKTTITTRLAGFRGAGLWVALIAAVTFAVPVLAHEAPCPLCGQTITQDTEIQDNETVLKAGRKRIEYKCVFCALSEAKSDYKGDVSILAPSEKKGEPIRLERTGETWKASSDGVRFLAIKADKPDHKVCQAHFRAFGSEGAAKAYIEKNKASLPGAVPLTLEQMLALVK